MDATTFVNLARMADLTAFPTDATTALAAMPHAGPLGDLNSVDISVSVEAAPSGGFAAAWQVIAALWTIVVLWKLSSGRCIWHVDEVFGGCSNGTGKDVLPALESSDLLPTAEGPQDEVEEEEEDGWGLVSSSGIGTDKCLQVFTRCRDGRCEVRYEASVPHGVAEMACLFGEVDLIPTWHPVVPRATFLGFDADVFSIDGVAEAKLPWPLPGVGIHFHLAADCDRLHDKGELCLSATCHSDKGKASLLPPWARRLFFLPVDGDIAMRFDPVQTSKTRFEVRFAINLRDLPKVALAPKRGIDFCFYVCGPMVWKAIIRLLDTQLSANTPIGARLAHDSLGAWGRLREALGQEAPAWVAAARADPRCKDSPRAVYTACPTA